MTKLNWRKYPDEKPLYDSDNDIIVIIAKPYTEPYMQACSYDNKEKKFYKDNYDGGWFNDYISDEYITHWIYLDEIPLPEE